ARLKRRTPDNGIADNPIAAHLKADGINIAGTAAAALRLRRLAVKRNFPAAVFDPSHRRFRGSGIQPVVEEGSPIKRRYSIQRLHQLVEGVGLHLRVVIGTAVEYLAEIINRFLAARLAMNDGRDFEPEQIALVVVIGAAAPVEPAASSPESQAGFSNGGVQ